MQPTSLFLRIPRLALASVALAAALISISACNSNSNTPTEPVAPEPPERITETFGGSLQLGGSSAYLFTVGVPGDVDLTLTSIQPLATLTLGMGIGTTEDGTLESCLLYAQDNSVRQGQTLLARAATGGTYCVSVYDVGNIFPGVTVTFTLDVTHP